MNRFAAITAAVAALGAASIATSARADTLTTCRMAGSVAGLAMMQRAHGASQHEAAATAGTLISQVANESPASYPVRVAIADRLASASTYIIRLVYSLPLDRSAPAWMLSDAAEQAVFDLCLSGDL